MPWLLIGLAGGIVTSRIIAQYEGQLRIDPSMAFFMPLIAATAGNVGVQSSAIVVQGLASGSMVNVNLLTRMWKELRVALLTALVCGAAIFAIVLVVRQNARLNLGLTTGAIVDSEEESLAESNEVSAGRQP